MDTITCMQQQMVFAHSLVEGCLEDLTAEQLHWLPSGSAHPNAATYAHLVLGEDGFLQGILQGKAPLAAGAWAGKNGLSAPPPAAGDWAEWARAVRVDLPALRQYAQAVYAATTAYVAGLKPEELDRPVDLPIPGLGAQPVAAVLGLVVQHANAHCGEIAAIKGLQGLKGYPF